MEKTTIKIIQLVASDGMVLTNGETYSREVYLGVNDTPDNWHEITEQEYNDIIEQEADEHIEDAEVQ